MHRERGCRAPRGRVDRNTEIIERGALDGGRAPRGRVDRNVRRAAVGRHQRGRAPRGRVDRNTGMNTGTPEEFSRAPRGRVDRNSFTVEEDEWTREVAPPAGAWIETHTHNRPGQRRPRRAPRGRVDRNKAWCYLKSFPSRGRAPRGRVDRNNGGEDIDLLEAVAPPAGAWIETCARGGRTATDASRPPRARG